MKITISESTAFTTPKYLMFLLFCFLFIIQFFFSEIAFADQVNELMNKLPCRIPVEKVNAKKLSAEDKKKMQDTIDFIEGQMILGDTTPEIFEIMKEVITCAKDPDVTYHYAHELTGANIGIMYTSKNDRWVVVGVMPNSPALLAGIQKGDVILKIDDFIMTGKPLFLIKTLLIGKENSSVKIEIQRAGEARIIEVKRKNLSYPEIDVKTADGIITLSILRLAKTTEEKLRTVIEQSMKGITLRGVILDLRNDTGGSLIAVEKAASVFLSKQTKFLQLSYLDGSKKILETEGEMIIPLEVPLVVIVNDRTTSGAEALAAILRKERQAKIIGERMAGIYDLKHVLSFDDKFSIGVRVGDLRYVSGETFKIGGELPDKIVRNSERMFLRGKDKQMEEAMKMIKKMIK